MVGQFKDDCLQDHRHEAYFQGGYDKLQSNSGGDYVMHPDTANTNAPSGRIGNVTRGKRKGVKYIIKVL